LRAEIGLDQVRGRLPAGNALVSFARYNRTLPAPVAGSLAANTRAASSPRTLPSYVAIVLRSGEAEPVLVPLGGADRIDRLITSWRQEMIADATRAPGAPQTGPSFRSIGASLRRQVWDPVAAHLVGAQRVYVVLDGALNLVPLAALPTTPGHFLLDDGPVIHYLSAERDLVVDEAAPVSAGGLLIVGGPSFSDGSSFARLATHPMSTVAATTPAAGAPFRGSSSGCNSFRSMTFPALPGSRAEAEAVAGLWRALERTADSTTQAVDLLIGNDATESAVKTLSVGRRVLHIATHGFFLDECAPAAGGTRSVGGLAAVAATPSQATTRPKATPPQRTPHLAATPENPMLLAGLALAGANRRSAAGPNEDDGILTAEEVASLDLEGVEWAVLSACNTGLGAVAAGEGVLGLRRAFQVAGVRTVIMSLWSVEDRATREWMEALYRARFSRRFDTADSVREASLSFIRDRRARGQSVHPFYWAGFVAAGDWR
jgi:CHAT domain-containing protein